MSRVRPAASVASLWEHTGKGNGYVKATNVEKLTNDDFVFDF
ncbi:hypothetical protein [Ectobacillus funiculus]|jgi:hypothetical protein|uniref:Uncharacterized protein n=1 Tax=Ectobacillus funiculus TaxID=137993 RepID=A0ABV5WGM5_9BACI|nr:hypothetical protein [Ectobacillus funiculus]